MFRFSLSVVVLFSLARYAAAGTAPSGPVALPSQCPSSGVLHLNAGTYSAQNVSLGNCTVVGRAPGAVIHGNIAFDHGLLKGVIHFNGGGAASSCVAGRVEVNGDDVRFHGCDIGWMNSIKVLGGRAQFEYGKQVCGLTIVAGSVNITNISGCEGYTPFRVGPGPVNLNMANVKHYGSVEIDGMTGRLGGSLQTNDFVSIRNSVVNFDTFRPEVSNPGAGFNLDNVTGSGSIISSVYHASSAIKNCNFHDMVYSVSMVRGWPYMSGTTWKRGSYVLSRYGGGELSVDTSDLQNVSVLVDQSQCWFHAGAAITSSNISGKIGLTIGLTSSYQRGDLPGQKRKCGLTIENSHVTFSPGVSASVGGPIRVSSSTLLFPGSSGALVGASNLVVNMSVIQVTGPLPHGSSVQIGGDIHMSNARLDVVNCSASWVSQSSTKQKQILI